MNASRSIRIRMPDRPGALSHICIAIAAFDVNIARLDVVSQDGGYVVDDLDLEGDTLALIDRAIGSFRDEVEVQYFEGAGTDPSLAVSDALETIARAARAQSAFDAVASGAAELCRADWGVLCEVESDGRARTLTGPAHASPGPIGRTGYLREGETIAADAETSLAFSEWLDRPATCIATAGVAPAMIAILGRKKDVMFAPGELRRFARFAAAAGAACQARGMDSGVLAAV